MNHALLTYRDLDGWRGFELTENLRANGLQVHQSSLGDFSLFAGLRVNTEPLANRLRRRLTKACNGCAATEFFNDLF
jgi:hypothetical protein